MTVNEQLGVSREQSNFNVRRRHFAPRQLQLLYRTTDCLRRSYDSGEVTDAIVDALVHEGVAAWPGDATSCVEQMIRVQYDARMRAERERDEAVSELKAIKQRVADLAREVTLRVNVVQMPSGVMTGGNQG